MMASGSIKLSSGVNTAELQDKSDAINGQHIGRDAIIHAIRLRIAYHFVEAVLHDIFEPLVDHAFAPKEALAVLHPFEIADRNAAGIGQDIRNHEYAFSVQRLVGARRHPENPGAVCAVAPPSLRRRERRSPFRCKGRREYRRGQRFCSLRRASGKPRLSRHYRSLARSRAYRRAAAPAWPPPYRRQSAILARWRSGAPPIRPSPRAFR